MSIRIPLELTAETRGQGQGEYPSLRGCLNRQLRVIFKWSETK